MTDWKWNLWCALPYGIVAVFLHVVGPVKALLWVGVQLEMAGSAVQDLAVALQTITGYRRAVISRKLQEMAARLKAADDEGRAHAQTERA